MRSGAIGFYVDLQAFLRLSLILCGRIAIHFDRSRSRD